MAVSIPVRLANGPGNPPDAANWMDNYDWLTAFAFGYGNILNGGQETWTAGTTFTNPANSTVLTDNWTLVKSGTTPCTADVSREASIVDTGSYSMKVNITGAGSSDAYWGITQNASMPSAFGSLTQVAGVRVKCATANKVRIKVYDGTTTNYSSYHTGDGTWQLLQAKGTMAAIPSVITVTVEINPANFTDAIYLDSIYLYTVPSLISTRALAALSYLPLSDATPLNLFLKLSGGTMTGNLGFASTKGVIGTATNDNATAGNVGERVSSAVGATNAPASTQFGDLTSISLTAGDWDVTAHVSWDVSGGTWAETIAGISTFSGNNTTGLNQGDNYSIGQWASSSTTPLVVDMTVPAYRISIASTTTVYLKYAAVFSAGTPKAYGRLSARRVR